MIGARDDSVLPSQSRISPTSPHPQSFHIPGSSAQISHTQPTLASKSIPDRYRRVGLRHSDGMIASQGSAVSSGSSMATVGHIYAAPSPVLVGRHRIGNENGNKGRPGSFAGKVVLGAMDDMQVGRQRVPEEAKRFRRRSIHTLDSTDYPSPLTPQALFAQQVNSEKFSRPQPAALQHQHVQPQLQPQKMSAISSRPITANPSVPTGSPNSRHSHHDSADSARSSYSANDNIGAGSCSGSNSRPSSSDSRQVNVPARTSSADVAKRALSPSPLSKPVTMGPQSAASASTSNSGTKSVPPESSVVPSSHSTNIVESSAAQHLAAINEKGKKSKSKTSRLRRAFSFGSAAELRKRVHENGRDSTRDLVKLHKERNPDDILDEEQARIAQKQEEAGIGNNIYGGTRFFSGSTDNLSISSTASSASIMIRKMGRGMKKGTRSLAGLFRPKSVIGVPAADTKVPEATRAAVSMVTVEAERERVNIHADLAQDGGETGFPHLEHTSVEIGLSGKSPSGSSERVGSSGTDKSNSRKSIVGGDKERAEVLGAVRKGILKHAGPNSPSPHPQDSQSPFNLPNVPAIGDSPNSSAPSTPNSDTQGHKRSDSVAIGSEDYFVTALRLRQDSKSAPNTPSGTVRRNATFSPRIVFHDTWPSQEYDRRGDIATCNRLTPMLAQQIKEELNNFKMEMEVHENSKIYTHFF